MATITRKRVLRPSTRHAESLYRVEFEGIGRTDTLHLTISHEENPTIPIGIYEFRGKDIGDKKSIYFKAEKIKGGWKINFIGVSPHVVQLFTGAR